MPEIDMQAFEADYLALLARYDVQQSVVLLKNGRTLYVRATGTDPAHCAGATEMARIIEKAVVTAKDRINQVMMEAAHA